MSSLNVRNRSFFCCIQLRKNIHLFLPNIKDESEQTQSYKDNLEISSASKNGKQSTLEQFIKKVKYDRNKYSFNQFDFCKILEGFSENSIIRKNVIKPFSNFPQLNKINRSDRINSVKFTTNYPILIPKKSYEDNQKINRNTSYGGFTCYYKHWPKVYSSDSYNSKNYETKINFNNQQLNNDFAHSIEGEENRFQRNLKQWKYYPTARQVVKLKEWQYNNPKIIIKNKRTFTGLHLKERLLQKRSRTINFESNSKKMGLKQNQHQNNSSSDQKIYEKELNKCILKYSLNSLSININSSMKK